MILVRGTHFQPGSYPDASRWRHAARILVADDDRAIRESLAARARARGLRGDVVRRRGGRAGQDPPRDVRRCSSLDVMMPGVDGLDGLPGPARRAATARRSCMLTARTETSDRVAGLDAGADDYLPKPFELDELLARLRALLRRARPRRRRRAARRHPAGRRPPARPGRPPRLAGRARSCELSKTEFDLLELLVRNAGIVLDHSTIYDRIWGYDFGPDSKNLAVYIGYLRRKVDAGRRRTADPHRPRRRLHVRRSREPADPAGPRVRRPRRPLADGRGRRVELPRHRRPPLRARSTGRSRTSRRSRSSRVIGGLPGDAGPRAASTARTARRGHAVSSQVIGGDGTVVRLRGGLASR